MGGKRVSACSARNLLARKVGLKAGYRGPKIGEAWEPPSEAAAPAPAAEGGAWTKPVKRQQNVSRGALVYFCIWTRDFLCHTVR